MDAASWAGVFQRIPADKEDLLVIVTTSGVEIIIQKILRVDAEFLILKGRLSGAIDAARAVLIPYNQINNLAVNKQLLEADVLAVFGCEGAAEIPKAERPAVADKPAPEKPPEPSKPTAPPAAAPSRAQSGPPSKSIFLQRLRARLAGDSSKQDSGS